MKHGTNRAPSPWLIVVTMATAALWSGLLTSAAQASHPERRAVLGSGERHLIVLPLQQEHAKLQRHEIAMLRETVVTVAREVVDGRFDVPSPKKTDTLLNTHRAVKRCKADCSVVAGRAIRADLVISGTVAHAFGEYTLRFSLHGTWPPRILREVQRSVPQLSDLEPAARAAATELVRDLSETNTPPTAEHDAPANAEGVAPDADFDNESDSMRLGLEVSAGLNIGLDEDANPSDRYGAYARIAAVLRLIDFLGLSLSMEFGGYNPDPSDALFELRTMAGVRGYVPTGPVALHVEGAAGLSYLEVAGFSPHIQVKFLGVVLRLASAVSVEVSDGLSLGLEGVLQADKIETVEVCSDFDCGGWNAWGFDWTFNAKLGLVASYLF